jgi:hypothetical protein
VAEGRRLGWFAIPVLFGPILFGIALVSTAMLAEPVPGPARPSPVSDLHVVYRIDDRVDQTVRFEELEVSRPFNGRVETTVDGQVVTGRVSNRQFQWVLATGGKPQFGTRRIPGGPTRDVSYAAMRDAVEAGLATAGGRGRVLGRSCTWFTFADPFPERLTPATEESRVETCVDPAGIMLREAWALSGRTVRVAEAIELDLDPVPSERFFVGIDPAKADVSQPEAADIMRTGSVVADVRIKVRGPIAIGPAPEGWRSAREAAATVASPVGGQAVQTASRAYVRGPDLVIVERGVQPSDDPSWPADEGEQVEVGFGNGRIVYYPDRVEVRITSGGGYARVIGPSREAAMSFADVLYERD